jgi:hypothetical protein
MKHASEIKDKQDKIISSGAMKIVEDIMLRIEAESDCVPTSTFIVVSPPPHLSAVIMRILGHWGYSVADVSEDGKATALKVGWRGVALS